MGLHQALNPNTIWVWRWYNAFVSRGGRAHLLRVPLILRENIQAPSWYYSDEERHRYVEHERTRGPLYRWPGYFYDDDVFTRHCNTTQAATTWNATEWWSHWREWTPPQRGVCNTCLRFALQLPRARMEGPNERQAFLHGSIPRATNLDNWMERARIDG